MFSTTGQELIRQLLVYHYVELGYKTRATLFKLNEAAHSLRRIKYTMAITEVNKLLSSCVRLLHKMNLIENRSVLDVIKALTPSVHKNTV